VSYFSSILALFALVDLGDSPASRSPAPPGVGIEESAVPSVLRLFKPFVLPLVDFLLAFALSGSPSLDSSSLETGGLYACVSTEITFLIVLRDRLTGVYSAVD